MLLNQSNTTRIGIALVVSGIFLLVLRMTGSLWGIISSLWPMILVAVGYYQLKLGDNLKQARILMFVGGILLLFTLNLLKLISILGPVVLILAGAYLLTRGSKGIASLMLGGFGKVANNTFRGTIKGLQNTFRNVTNRKEASLQAASSSDVSTSAFFRSNSYTATNFSGGSGKCILGDLDIDLRQAKTTEDIIYMSATCSFGYISIKIPLDWQVEIVNKKFLGDIIDSSQQEGSINTTLKLNAHCFFGDIRIRN